MEHVLVLIMSHIGQRPCICPNSDLQRSFTSQILTIPFLWQLFPYLKQVVEFSKLCSILTFVCWSCHRNLRYTSYMGRILLMKLIRLIYLPVLCISIDYFVICGHLAAGTLYVFPCQNFFFRIMYHLSAFIIAGVYSPYPGFHHKRSESMLYPSDGTLCQRSC